jgi:peptidoglycan/xylan/chitin deacetylase (PgdA/CDA1 family)
MFKILLLVMFILVTYMIFPYILTAGFGIGVVKRKNDSSKIAFTFDDGPNPIYTPQLLDLLKEYNIKATFFVLGAKAEKNPEIILRMHNEGHLIAIHNFVHKSNWVMSPWNIRRQLKKSASIVEEIIGVNPVYYRPPWGLMNVFDFFLLKQYKIILWSVMAEDWRSKGGSEKVKNQLLRKIKTGDVILLHDCGETLGADYDAPMYTIKALSEVLKEMDHRKLSCVRIDEL